MSDQLSRNKSRLDRSVISYAFLAQATRGEGDLFSGLAPIFKPIAKIHAGKTFDASEFSKLVDELYGLKVHPWAVDDLIPRLENAGLLLRTQHTEEMHEYVYAEITEEFDAVTEKDIKYVIQRFVEFAKPILQQNRLPVDEVALEEGFLSQLVDMSFVSILLKPDRTKEDARGTGTITLKKPKEQAEWEEHISTRAKVDVLCASFIVDVYHNDEGLYDLIMRIATGAIISEVVLNLQDPGETVSLKGLNVMLDAPFLMSALNLSSEEAHTFAVEICDQLRDKEAALIAFEHSIDELKDNLNAVINKTKDGMGFGATARRLKNLAFAAYANSVLKNTDTVLKQHDIRQIAAPGSTASFQYFTDTDREEFQRSLGFYYNRRAQERDAESIAAVVRLRRGKQVKMGRLPMAEYVFITENAWVATQAERFLKRRKLFNDGEVPPALSEKYLAGLLWVLYGGKGHELTRHLLLANCAAALEPRSDVIAQMHRFLSQVDDKQAELFSALMTEERAGQYAMQLTLGDSSFITKENAPIVLEQIKKSLIEKHEADKRREMDSIQQDHESELDRNKEVSERLRQELMDANAEGIQTKNKLDETKRRVDQIEEALKVEKRARNDEKKRLVGKCVKTSVKYEKRIHVGIGLLIAAISGLIVWFELLSSQLLWVKVLAVAAIALVAILTFWKVPDYVLADWVHNMRNKKYKKCLEDLDLHTDADLFLIDWNSHCVLLKEDNDMSVDGGFGN
ncbi:MAG: hypothetical protein ABW201_04020 [Candidatus Thiodiazotropha sp.]